MLKRLTPGVGDWLDDARPVFPRTVPPQYDERDSRAEAYRAHVAMVGGQVMSRWLQSLRYAKGFTFEKLGEVLGYEMPGSLVHLNGSTNTFLSWERYQRLQPCFVRGSLADTWPVSEYDQMHDIVPKFWPLLDEVEQDSLHQNLMVGRIKFTPRGDGTHCRGTGPMWMKEAFVRIHELRQRRDALHRNEAALAALER